MRYIINDDTLEEWVTLLIEVTKTKDQSTLEYVIEDMRGELTQHFTEEQIDKHFPFNGVLHGDSITPPTQVNDIKE